MLTRYKVNEPTEQYHLLADSKHKRWIKSLMPAEVNTERPFRGKDLSGSKFSRLTVICFCGFYRTPGRPNQRVAVWKCACECGKETTANTCQLVGKNTRSCGCFQSEIASARLYKHGHRKIRHRLYWLWQGMIQRCTNPEHHGWKWYGGKGIKVCDRWREFPRFLEDMETGFKEGLTLDRKDGNKDYFKENCRWATWAEQRRNMSK